MDPMPIAAVLEAVKGRWRGQAPSALQEVLEVSTDTRTMTPGCLFVALRGPERDGHSFIGEALQRGAGAALVQSGWKGEVPEGAPLIEVDDPLAALERLATRWRETLGAETAAVTGTVGKTTTKEFLGVLLATRFPTVRAPKSYNNRLGVSLTLLSARRGARFIVCETGTSGPGELARLSRLVRPSLVVVTEIGHAHLQGLGSLEGVIREKCEVFEGIRPGAKAYLHAGAPGRHELARAARARGAEVVSFGLLEGDWRVTCCRRLRRLELDLPAGETPVGFRFTVRDPLGHEEELILAVPGLFNVQNALAAIAAARDAGLDWAAIRAGVRDLSLLPRRFQVGRWGGVVVVDDTYNASRRSVLAALEEAAEIPLEGEGGRRWLVLGGLLELGGFSREIHREIGASAAAARPAFAGLIAVGEEARPAAEAAEESSHRVGAGPFLVRRVGCVEDAPACLEELLRPGDLVLFKASRAVGLERAVEETQRRLAARGTGDSATGSVAQGGRAACSTTSTT